MELEHYFLGTETVGDKALSQSRLSKQTGHVTEALSTLLCLAQE